MKNVLGMLKGRTKLDTLENWSVASIVLGGLTLAAGITLSAWWTQGLPALLTMAGTFVSFLSTVALIFIWLAKEVVKDEAEGG